MLVYILSTYDEHGAEEVIATLDRTKLVSMIDKFSNLYSEWYEKNKELLTKLLEQPDDDLMRPNGLDIDESVWSGLQLHIVELV